MYYLVRHVQALLPALFGILQRGRDNAAVFSALEPFVLLGGAQLLAPFERALFGGLHRSMAALATELTAASEPPQPPKPGARSTVRPGIDFRLTQLFYPLFESWRQYSHRVYGRSRAAAAAKARYQRAVMSITFLGGLGFWVAKPKPKSVIQSFMHKGSLSNGPVKSHWERGAWGMECRQIYSGILTMWSRKAAPLSSCKEHWQCLQDWVVLLNIIYTIAPALHPSYCR